MCSQFLAVFQTLRDCVGFLSYMDSLVQMSSAMASSHFVIAATVPQILEFLSWLYLVLLHLFACIGVDWGLRYRYFRTKGENIKKPITVQAETCASKPQIGILDEPSSSSSSSVNVQPRQPWALTKAAYQSPVSLCNLHRMELVLTCGLTVRLCSRQRLLMGFQSASIARRCLLRSRNGRLVLWPRDLWAALRSSGANWRWKVFGLWLFNIDLVAAVLFFRSSEFLCYGVCTEDCSVFTLDVNARLAGPRQFAVCFTAAL